MAYSNIGDQYGKGQPEKNLASSLMATTLPIRKLRVTTVRRPQN